MRALLFGGALSLLLASTGVATAAPQVPAVPIPAAPASAVREITPERELALVSRRAPEMPTLFLFYRPGSATERSFAAGFEKELAGRIGLRWIPVRSGTEPLVKQYQVTETPTAMVYDRRGRLVTRSSDAAAIQTAVRKAADVMRIDWAADDDPRMQQIEKVMGRRLKGGIMKTMSLAPDFLFSINDLARKAHFSDGFLDRRVKEMIATHVSALNECKF